MVLYLTMDRILAFLFVNAADGGEITTSQLLLGIWSEAESPGHKILAALGFDDNKAKELKSQISEPEYDG